MNRAAFDLVALTPIQRAEALSSGNKYYTWLNLGRPKRDVTDEEAVSYWVATEFQQHGSAMFCPISQTLSEKDGDPHLGRK